MTPADSDVRQWLAGWKAAAARMAELRRQDLQRVDISQVIEGLDDAFESALAHSTPSSTSGLVSLQALFMKGRR